VLAGDSLTSIRPAVATITPSADDASRPGFTRPWTSQIPADAPPSWAAFTLLLADVG
jgi:hypothetical protein